MYQLSESTVTKRIESWKLIVPLHDNNGIDFDHALIDSITQGIVDHFPGATLIHCAGRWRDGEQMYTDRNLELIIDIALADSTPAEAFFAKYKRDLAIHLQQSKIYLTREQSKEEVISFDEFFREVGLEIAADASESEKRKIAQDAIENADFLLRRMGYETTLLRRDTDRSVIVWERYICGISLVTEIADGSPHLQLLAADRIDHYVEWLKQPSDVLVIGDWEFQKFALSNRPFTPLVQAEVPSGIDFKVPQYLTPYGQPISHKRFIEEFTMGVVCGIMALRDEGFHPEEIAVTVGSDGTMQWTTDPARKIVFFSPAPIPDSPIQEEILRCVRIAIRALRDGKLPPLSVQQAKALHRYIFKRAAIRLALQNKL